MTTEPSRGGPRALSSRLPPWVSRDYVLLTGSAVVTGVGGAGSMVAAAFAVLRGGGDATAVGAVAAARTVTLVLFLLVGGAVADRLPRHRVMVASNILNCASQAAFAFLVLTGHPPVWQMAGLSALGGVGQAFFNPAAEGMLMAGTRSAHAGQAFAFFRISVNGATIGGSALAGALIAAVGPGWVLALEAAGFAVAALLRSFLRVTGPPAQPAGGGMVSDLRDGWREFTARRWLWGIVAAFSVINAVFSASEAVYGPLVAQRRLGGAAPWGLALAAFGLGTLLGGVVMTRWRPRRLLLSGTLCVFPLASVLVVLAVVPPVPVIDAAMLVSGLGIEVFGVSWMIAVHQEVPHDKLSRVSAYDWLGSVSVIPVATALAGPAADAVGLSTALWISAAAVVLLTAAVLALPEVRRLARTAPDAAREAAPDGPNALTPR